MVASPSPVTKGWRTSLRDEGTAGITLGLRDGAMALWDGTAPLSIGRRDRSLASRTEEQSPSLQDGGLAHGSPGLTDGARLPGTKGRRASL